MEKTSERQERCRPAIDHINVRREWGKRKSEKLLYFIMGEGKV